MRVFAADPLAQVSAGFDDPVRGAQQAFRTLLNAMAYPGRVQRWPSAARAGLQPPPGLDLGLAVALLALLDAETSLHLLGDAAQAEASLRFHTGVRFAQTAAGAEFVAGPASALHEVVWSALHRGSDEVPQLGATLLLEVDSLHDGTVLALRGPGIRGSQVVSVRGLSPCFWAWRCGLHTLRPRGIELVLTCGDELVALPRSTQVVVVGPAG